MFPPKLGNRMLKPEWLILPLFHTKTNSMIKITYSQQEKTNGIDFCRENGIIFCIIERG
jgi:hypothetical protein